MNIYDDYAKKDIDIKNLRIRIKELEEENKKLKEKIIVRDKHCNDLKWLLDKWLKKYRELKEVNKKLKEELERYKKQYEHTMGED